MFGDKSPFATTAFGGSAPPFQMGLAVELTSTFNSTTGYSWKQLLLDTGASPAAYAVPTYYRTGDGAFTPDNNQTLTSGTQGWLEIDPQAKGFIFVPTTPASATVSTWKEPVRVATTTAGTLASSFENGDTVDGVVLVTGNRILIKDQTTGTENGIYTVNASGSPTRSADGATADLVGATVFVQLGTANGMSVWNAARGYQYPWNKVSISPFKPAVRVATTVAGTLSTSFEAGDTIDAIVLAAGDRILIKNQSTASQNGIYIVQSSGSPVRAGDADVYSAGSSLVISLAGATVPVSEGTINGGTSWRCYTTPTNLASGDNLWEQCTGFRNASGGLSSGGGSYSITPDTTYVNTFVLSAQIPGNYLVLFSVTLSVNISAGAPAYIEGKIYDVGAAAYVTDPFQLLCVTTTGVAVKQLCTVQWIFTSASVSNSYRLDIQRSAGPTYSTCSVIAPCFTSIAQVKRM